MTGWEQFASLVEESRPECLVVLGSGLAEVADSCPTLGRVVFSEIPGLVRPTVHGHQGLLALGRWMGRPVLLSLGRVHFYEGHSVERVTRVIQLAAQFGCRRVILTNAAGGLRRDLLPGSLMPIRAHLPLLNANAWKSSEPASIYDVSWVPRWGQDLRPGVYAALTGPSYETPAEIRGLRNLGIDAVGMSTAREAEAAVALGLRVVGISCITNLAAGLAPGTLSHGEVEQNAKLALERLRHLLTLLITEPN